MSDSVATLVISTGLLQRAPTDDALLGAVAHEIAHEFYARRLRELKQQYLLLSASGDAIPMQRTRVEVAELELDCDAFAAMTLAVIGRNPKEFSNLLIAISKDFNEQVAPDHPSADLRAKFITGIVRQETLAVTPQVTKQLLAMKSLALQASTAYSKNKQ
jgi:Zn-dependent protease with chaperone function